MAEQKSSVGPILESIVEFTFVLTGAPSILHQRPLLYSWHFMFMTSSGILIINSYFVHSWRMLSLLKAFQVDKLYVRYPNHA